MTAAAAGAALATGVAVAALLVAERRESALGRWIAKPLASTGFVAFAFACGAAETDYGRAVLVALALSWLGDVLLIPADERAFRAGVGAFLLGHVAYLAAFSVRGIPPIPFAAALAAATLATAPVLRWLRPHVPRAMKGSVLAYVGVIAAMVAGALATFAAEPRAAIAAGALAFWLSDLSVARDRFVAPGFTNRAWGLPLYYAAQLLLASSVT